MNLDWIFEEEAKTSIEMRPKNPVNDSPSLLDEKIAQQNKGDHDLIDVQTPSTSGKRSDDCDEKIDEKIMEKKRKIGFKTLQNKFGRSQNEWSLSKPRCHGQKTIGNE